MIVDSIFDEEGILTADDSVVFEDRNRVILKLVKNYPKFVSYCTNKVIPVLKNYLFFPSKDRKLERNWTNNNAESLNHIMKLDAKWKPGKTVEMIENLYGITELHFKDFRRALYGGGNYRLANKSLKTRFGVSKDEWCILSESERTDKFQTFLRNQNRKSNSDFVKSSYSNFKVPKPTAAKKTGQRKRSRSVKTKVKH